MSESKHSVSFPRESGDRWPVLPQHTIEVRLGIGTNLDPDRRSIQVEG